MNKDEVMKFLNTASPEVFSEIKVHMVQIMRDKDSAQNLAKQKEKSDRLQRICELRQSGMTFKQIAEIFNISSGRCQQIHAREMLKRKIWRCV
jgi:DNA-directed RNA polymerase specialized sigma subunit